MFTSKITFKVFFSKTISSESINSFRLSFDYSLKGFSYKNLSKSVFASTKKYIIDNNDSH